MKDFDRWLDESGEEVERTYELPANPENRRLMASPANLESFRALLKKAEEDYDYEKGENEILGEAKKFSNYPIAARPIPPDFDDDDYRDNIPFEWGAEE